jgi:hypothetical protein
MVSLLSEEATRPGAQGWAGRAKARLAVLMHGKVDEGWRV